MEKILTLEWKQAYEVGNFDIDAEHKIFLHIILKIQRAYIQKAPVSYLEALVSELIKYADFHFCSEENLMRAVDYPDLKNHQEVHKRLMFQLNEEVNTVVFKYINFHTLIEFLYQWFLEHTTEEDKKLAVYIQNRDRINDEPCFDEDEY